MQKPPNTQIENNVWYAMTITFDGTKSNTTIVKAK